MRAFAGEFRAVKVHVIIRGGIVEGERIPDSTISVVDDKMVPRPVTLVQEKRLTEGQYKAGDMKFYVDGPAKYDSGDLIEYKGVKYRIGDISSREEGGYVYYMGKRLYDQN